MIKIVDLFSKELKESLNLGELAMSTGDKNIIEEYLQKSKELKDKIIKKEIKG